MIKQCAYCGCKFKLKYKAQKYCSSKCCGKDQQKSKIQKCAICGKEFIAENWRPRKYCSCKCAGEYRSLKALENRPQLLARKERERLEREKIKTIKSLISVLNKIVKRLEPKQMPIYNLVCFECGKEFTTKRSNKKYCSDKCSRKHYQKLKDKRIYKNGKPDLSISLSKIYEKYNGVCVSCGIACDWHDVNVREDGTIVAGETYPSIDHIKPISKGGKHEWDNVQLMCRHCNSIKNDKE